MARDAPQIDAFGGGGFRLSGRRVEGSILILGDVARSWSPSTLAEATPFSLQPVFDAGPQAVEFVLLGVGAVNAPPPKDLRRRLQSAGIGLEFMDTPAACRMYNILTGEGRRLAAALIAI